MSRKSLTIRGGLSAEPSTNAWVRHGTDPLSTAMPSRAEIYTARLTIDVTPELRGRIKVHAFTKGTTVAELLRSLLEREYPNDSGAS